jgi:hypothetical protein
MRNRNGKKSSDNKRRATATGAETATGAGTTRGTAEGAEEAYRQSRISREEIARQEMAKKTGKTRPKGVGRQI